MEWIRKARQEGRKALTEFESKKVLAEYGIPVTRELVVRSREGLLAAVEEIGFPLVIKGCGADLAHKTEQGLVQVDVRTPEEASAVFDRFAAAMAGEEGAVLVQEMVRGRRELAMGLVRDAQFGPCVMFGLGGIFAEVLADTAFRVAPIDEKDARSMMDEIRGHRILGEIRGMASADRKALADMLVRLGEIGEAHPEIAEIDINPVILDAAGRPVAADALIAFTETAD